MKAVKADPTITQKELAAFFGKSERTIKRRMAELQEKGHLRYTGGKRNSHWEALIEV